MVEDVTPKVDEQADATKEAPAKDAAVTPPADATGQNSGNADRTFTQADLDRIVTERLEREREKSKKEAAKAQADAEAKVLAEQGKYKELYDKQQAELAEAQALARASEMRLNQREAAMEAKLPLALADRLKGETKEEMVADAKAILATLPKPEAPNINAGNGAGGAPGQGGMSDAEKKRIADKYGVDPRFVQ